MDVVYVSCVITCRMYAYEFKNPKFEPIHLIGESLRSVMQTNDFDEKKEGKKRRKKILA